MTEGGPYFKFASPSFPRARREALSSRRAARYLVGMKARPKPDWDAHERAHIARRREDYLELTPAQRLEAGASLSRVATELAVSMQRTRDAKPSA